MTWVRGEKVRGQSRQTEEHEQMDVREWAWCMEAKEKGLAQTYEAECKVGK